MLYKGTESLLCGFGSLNPWLSTWKSFFFLFDINSIVHEVHMFTYLIIWDKSCEIEELDVG